MENIAAIKPNIDRSFLRWWVLANIVALPALLVPYKLGMFLAMGVAVAADGASVGSVVYIIGFVILLLCGALIGGWFGFLQWLVLRKYMSQAGKWVAASSIGLAIGTPLGWLAYGLLFISPIVNRQDSVTAFPECPTNLINQIYIDDALGIQFIQVTNLDLGYFWCPLW